MRSARAPDSSPGHELFAYFFPGQCTHVSSSWLLWLQGWVVLLTAHRRKQTRINPSWRDSLDVVRRSATVRSQPGTGLWRLHVHDPATRDQFFPNLPPSVQGQGNKSWAYGASLINPDTTWNADSRVLNMVYLMSPSSPYQVQLMKTAVATAQSNRRVKAQWNVEFRLLHEALSSASFSRRRTKPTKTGPHSQV